MVNGLTQISRKSNHALKSEKKKPTKKNHKFKRDETEIN